MSNSSARGLYLERQVAGILRKKLGAKVQRDSRSGAGVNKSDISDYYQQIPLHLEIKNQETVKIKEWFRQASDAASFTQAPTVVFAAEEEVLACLRFSDLVNFMVEIADQKAEIDDLRTPIEARDLGHAARETGRSMKHFAEVAAPAVKKKKSQGAKMCRNGHIADEYGYCQQKDCKYSRGYRPPKVKRR
jgi:Holliday junction resolvase